MEVRSPRRYTAPRIPRAVAIPARVAAVEPLSVIDHASGLYLKNLNEHAYYFCNNNIRWQVFNTQYLNTKLCRGVARCYRIQLSFVFILTMFIELLC
ncbi:unnamed protein product [Chrysodeixis includens]|uniref:Uncharacterized protein n=1 Tax=Chrysodeixis includens TaxID=689277 RepID=A0A9N8KQG1_CHRIL|nr:unnamed protein product [Chrysodeixis includens]